MNENAILQHLLKDFLNYNPAAFMFPQPFSCGFGNLQK